MNTNQSVLATRALSVRYAGVVYAVPSVEAAAGMWQDFRDEAMRQGASPDDIGGGLQVRDSKKRVVARITWNGRIVRLSA